MADTSVDSFKMLTLYFAQGLSKTIKNPNQDNLGHGINLKQDVQGKNMRSKTQAFGLFTANGAKVK